MNRHTDGYATGVPYTWGYYRELTPALLRELHERTDVLGRREHRDRDVACRQGDEQMNQPLEPGGELLGRRVAATVGHLPGGVHLRVRAGADVSRALRLRSGEPVLHVRRVLSFSGVPTILEDLWLPGNSFKGLIAERLSEYDGPMYALFETEFGVRMLRAIYARHPKDFTWKVSSIDRLAGTDQLRAAVEQGTVDALLARWNSESASFRTKRAPYLLYR